MNVMRLFAQPTLAKFPITHAVDGAQDGGIGLTSMLSLPTSFGDIYLGQPFNCYVNIVNNNSPSIVTSTPSGGSSGDVEIVSLTAELSFTVLRSNGARTTQKVQLQDARRVHSKNPSQPQQVSHAGTILPPGKNADFLIEHQLLSEEYRYAPDSGAPGANKSPRPSSSSSAGSSSRKSKSSKKKQEQAQRESTYQLSLIHI